MTQQSLFPDSAPNAEPAPAPLDTRAAAAAAIAPLVPSLHERVRDFIASRGHRGATDHEIQSELGLSGDTARPRRRQLVKSGIVVASGRTRLSPSGNPMTVWIATQGAMP
jgi:hypothetical protein